MEIRRRFERVTVLMLVCARRVIVSQAVLMSLPTGETIPRPVDDMRRLLNGDSSPERNIDPQAT